MAKGDILGQDTSTGAQTKVYYAMDGGKQNTAYDTLKTAYDTFKKATASTDVSITWKKAIDAFVATDAVALGEVTELGDQSQSANTSEYAVYGESTRRKRSAPASVDDWTCAVAINRTKDSGENHRELMDADTGDKAVFVLKTATSATDYTFDIIFGDLGARSTARAVEEVATLTVTVAPNPAPFYQDNIAES